MFFDDVTSIPKIAVKSGFSLFVLEGTTIDSIQNTKKRIKTATTVSPEFPPNTIYLEPDSKNSIKIDAIRELEEKMKSRETGVRFFVVKHAECLNEAAENAALKLLEEPRDNYHLVFLATSLLPFLPTILSRAAIYIRRVKNPLESPIDTDEKTLNAARSLLKATRREAFNLVTLWTTKPNKKEREEILKILSITIEIAYKSYFKTKNQNFLKKIPSLITAYENIKGNGHIKLQLLAHLC